MGVKPIEHILSLLPEDLSAHCRQSFSNQENIEELRIRVGCPIEWIIQNRPFYLTEARIVTKTDAKYILNQLSDYSLYAFEDELRQGYITLRGGHRVGIGGKAVTESGKIKTLKWVSFFNVRFARAIDGISRPLLNTLYMSPRWHNTLMIGAPQSGKTTLLRDLTKQISTGVSDSLIPPAKVSLIDERSEIAACYEGVPELDVGIRTDVFDGCPKSEGMMMAIRAMSPDVLVVDEIGKQQDADAILEAVNTGVSVICTVHGRSIEEVLRRPTIRQLINSGIFERYVELSHHPSGKRQMTVRDPDGERVVSGHAMDGSPSYSSRLYMDRF